MQLSKKGLGINGIHTRLGNEITEAEFRGYMIAAGEERARQIEEVKIDVKELKTYIDKLLVDANQVHKGQSDRITSLENSRTQMLGFISGVTAVTTIVVSLILKFVFNA